MFDPEQITDAACHGKDCDDMKIAACKAASGAIKEIVYCPLDSCYYVTVDGRERLRSDVPETAYNFFSGTAPE